MSNETPNNNLNEEETTGKEEEDAATEEIEEREDENEDRQNQCDEDEVEDQLSSPDNERIVSGDPAPPQDRNPGAYKQEHSLEMHSASKVPIISVDCEVPSTPIVTATVLMDEQPSTTRTTYETTESTSTSNTSYQINAIGSSVIGAALAVTADVIIDGPVETAHLVRSNSEEEDLEKRQSGEIRRMRRMLRWGGLALFLCVLILVAALVSWAFARNGGNDGVDFTLSPSESPTFGPITENCSLCPDGKPSLNPSRSSPSFQNRTCAQISALLDSMSPLQCPPKELRQAAAINCGCGGLPFCSLCPDGIPPPNATQLSLDTSFSTCGQLDFALRQLTEHQCLTNQAAIQLNSFHCGCPGVAPTCGNKIGDQNKCPELVSNAAFAFPERSCDCYSFCDGELLGCYDLGTQPRSVCQGELVSGCSFEGVGSVPTEESSDGSRVCWSPWWLLLLLALLF